MILKKKKRLNQIKDFNYREIIKRCFIFSLAFLILGTAVSLIISLALYRLKDNTSFVNIGSTASLFLSITITAFMQSKINKHYYLLGSIVLGLITFGFIVIITLILNEGSISTNSLLVKSLIPAFSVLGGMLGIKNEKSRKKHHR